MAPTEKTPARTILSMAALRDHPALPADLATHELPMPKTAGIEVTTLTLKKGVEVATVDPSLEAAAHEPELHSVQPTITLDRNTDLLVRLNRSELVELRPFKEGWYAELAVDAEAKSALDKFSTAVYSLGKAKHPQLAFASPFTEAGPKAAADGKVASVHAKVTEYCGRMMSTSFTNGPDTDPSFHTFRPGAKVLDAYERQPVGPCVPTLHLYGYWRDKTKFGPLIYLSHSITVAPTTPRIDATPGTAQVMRFTQVLPKSGSPKQATASTPTRIRRMRRPSVESLFDDTPPHTPELRQKSNPAPTRANLAAACTGEDTTGIYLEASTKSIDGSPMSTSGHSEPMDADGLDGEVRMGPPGARRDLAPELSRAVTPKDLCADFDMLAKEKLGLHKKAGHDDDGGFRFSKPKTVS